MIILCAVITATACFVTAMFTYFYITSQERGNEILLGSGNYEDITKYMEISDLEKIIDDYYYRDVEEGTLVSGALKGMVNSLGDPYSVYYSEEEYKEYTANSEGLFVGVGMVMEPYTKDTGYLKVVRTYNGGPAQENGILADDVIVAVNGVNLKNLDYDGAVSLVTGPSGSEVTLTVSTDNVSRDVTVTRTEVQAPAVFENMLDDRVGYIIISEFSGDCVDEFKEALRVLREEEEASGIVIDLRGNMGGNVNYALDMLDEIMPEGLLGYSIDKSGDKTEWTADENYSDIPISVLVNGGTASASEIFAGAVQDGKRGKIIGSVTYGKGVSQAVMNMPYSGGGVKLTTATYFTPRGHEINGVGITPDEVVELTESAATLTAETDKQLQAAKQAIYDQAGGV